MKSNELRKAFLDYFRDRGHTVVPSASLVPEGDPSLLFNIAGMVQFKQFYASKGAIPFTRAASVQKCLRANDLDEVGRTAMHHTFFEMLGNFSFGDYFKQEAIEWAWDFITNVVGLPVEKLYITIYEDDDEAENIWVEQMGIAREKIYRLDKCDNFWGPAGRTGACGPCSEIHFDRGSEVGCGSPDCTPACDCDRFVEVWNLVFPQFFQDEEGNQGPLERKGVDTGMGLERLAMASQGAESTFETDIFLPIIEFVKDEANIDRRDTSQEVAVRVIADHARGLCFAISEGVLPSNEGRGYVIRRILRRAVVKALELGIREAFIYKVAGRVIDVMRDAYPELTDHQEKIALIIKADEERFEKTLSRGMAILKDALEDLKAKKDDVVSGDIVFKLYDTYGFPVEITRELAETQGFKIDLDSFESEMEAQRQRARQSSKIGGDREVADDMGRAPESFVGYGALEVPTVISAMRRGGDDVASACGGEEVEIELERTPFYPEGGGQVSDVGTVAGNSGRGCVKCVAWLGGDTIMHRVAVESGTLSVGDGVVAKVDVPKRKATQRNHTATHLLHSALRSVLGGHVRQSGSLVAPDRLRFDFTHYEPLSDAEVTKIEDMVNARLLDNMPVQSSVEAYESARDRGVIALFGEKYGQEVRVVNIEATSCELCGGTHVMATGEIGAFRIISESGIASGVRRIEAMTGSTVVDAGRDSDREIERIATTLRVPVHDVEEGARKTVERLKALEREVSDLRGRLAGTEVGDILKSAVDVKGIKVIGSRVDAPDLEMLKRLADRLKEKLPDGVICIGSASPERVFIVVSVSPSVVEQRGVKASAIAKKMGEMVGGRGGGKDTFAQAGGKDESNLDNALGQCAEVVGSLAR